MDLDIRRLESRTLPTADGYLKSVDSSKEFNRILRKWEDNPPLN